MEQDYLVGEVGLNKLETLLASCMTPSKGIRPLRVQASNLRILIKECCMCPIYPSSQWGTYQMEMVK